MGPDLTGVTEKRSKEWLHEFIKSSQTMIKRGDPDAVAVFKENNELIMTDIALAAGDIDLILEYIATSLIAKERVKINFFVKIRNENLNSVLGNYELEIWYQDIYMNFYNQIHRISFLKADDRGGTFWQLSLVFNKFFKRSVLIII